MSKTLLLSVLSVGVVLAVSGCNLKDDKTDLDSEYQEMGEGDLVPGPGVRAPRTPTSRKSAPVFEDDYDNDGAEAEYTDAGPPELVVQQIGYRKLVLSKNSRKNWLEISSSREDSRRKIGAALAIGEWDAAIALAKRYLAKKPGDEEALNLLIAALIYGRKTELASYYAELLHELQPRRPEYLNVEGLSMILSSKASMEDYRKAESLLKLAFNKERKPIAAGLNLGYFYLETGNARQAGRVFRTLIDRGYAYTPILRGYGISLCRIDQYDKAKGYFEKVLSKSKRDARSLYYLALIQWKGYKNDKTARNYLEDLLASSNHPVLRDKAKKLLKRLKT